MGDVVLHPGRERSVRRRHPWVLSGAVARVDSEPAPGDAVCVRSSAGEVLGYGHYSPSSQLRVRMLTFGKEPPAEELVEARLHAAVARRANDPLIGDTNALRLVNAEGDGLPGIVVDRYDDVVVVKLTSAGSIARREAIAAALESATGAGAGYERADTSAARREGMAAKQGALWGAVPSGPVEISERGRRYAVDVAEGQKTGFYLDQRDARDLVGSVAAGKRVLDLFSYTGGFAAAAGRGGAASVTLVDSSAGALELAARNVESNAPELETISVREDAFRFVRGSTERFDLIVVDPPPLARHRRDVPKASRAYKDVLVHALQRAEPGALVLTFKCSHHIGPDLFRKIAFGASLDAHRSVSVLRELGAPADHPVSLDHPEGAYLSGLLLRA